jgi:hypothetical protein
MGNVESVPFPHEGTNPGYVGIILRSFNKVRILHGQPEVIQAVERIIM